MIDAALLKKRREKIAEQHQQALVTLHQLTGALAFIDQILAENAEPGDAMNLDELKDMIGADTIEIVSNESAQDAGSH